ncbi:hypothetical protein D6D23_01586 [Aureobasidium pullulans]|nr:hypothetical protein D6D23_01586 [Aureobasidium pullulans]
MSSPPYDWQGSSSLPPNPYGPPEDVVSQMWQQHADNVRANLALPDRAGALLSSIQDQAPQPQSSPQFGHAHRLELQGSQTQTARAQATQMETQTPQMSAPPRHFHSIQATSDQAPPMQTPRMYTPQMQTSQMYTSQMQSPQMQIPQGYNSQIQDPHAQIAPVWAAHTQPSQMQPPGMQTPQMHGPRRQSPSTQALSIQAAQNQAVQLQTPQAAIAQMQADRGQAPQIQTFRMQTARMQAPQGQAAQIQAALAQAPQLLATPQDVTQAALTHIMASRARQAQLAQAQVAQAQAARSQAHPVPAAEHHTIQAQPSNGVNPRVWMRNRNKRLQAVVSTPTQLVSVGNRQQNVGGSVVHASPQHVQTPVMAAQHAQIPRGNGAHASGQQTQISRYGIPLEQSFGSAGARVLAQDVHPANRSGPQAQITRRADSQAGWQRDQPSSRDIQLAWTEGFGVHANVQQAQQSRHGLLLQQPIWGGAGVHANAQSMQPPRDGAAPAQHVGAAGIVANDHQQLLASRKSAPRVHAMGGTGVHASMHQIHPSRSGDLVDRAARAQQAQFVQQVHPVQQAQSVQQVQPVQQFQQAQEARQAHQAQQALQIQKAQHILQTHQAEQVLQARQVQEEAQRSRNQALIEDVIMQFAVPSVPESKAVDRAASDDVHIQGSKETLPEVAALLTSSRSVSPESNSTKSSTSRSSQIIASGRVESSGRGKPFIDLNRSAGNPQIELLQSSNSTDPPLDDREWEAETDLDQTYQLDTSEEMISSPLEASQETDTFDSDATPRAMRELLANEPSAGSRSTTPEPFNSRKRQTPHEEGSRKRQKAFGDRIDDIVMDVAHKPRAQIELEFVRIVEDLGMIEPESSQALAALRWMLNSKENTKENRKWPVVFKKWLLAMMRHSLNARMKTGDMTEVVAGDTEVVTGDTEPAKQVAPFCSKELHTLKCGHQSPSSEECGMNCYASKQLGNNVRLTGIKCVVCSRWILGDE